MKEPIFKELKLNRELEKKLTLISARKIYLNNIVEKILIIFESENYLLPKEICDLVYSFNELSKRNRLFDPKYFIVDIINKRKLSILEIYEYLLAFINRFISKKNNSDFYLQDSTIFVSNNAFFKLLTNHLPLINILFQKCQIIETNLIVDFDHKTEKIRLDNSIKFKEKIINSESEILQVHPFHGFKPLSPASKIAGNNFYFEGEVFEKVIKLTKNKKFKIRLNVGHLNQAIAVSFFSEYEAFKNINETDKVRVYGNWKWDTYINDWILESQGKIQPLPFDFFKDKIPKINLKNSELLTKFFSTKRTELHLHSRMSTMDGTGEVKDYLQKAANNNFRAITFVDHNSVQIHHEVFQESKNFKDLKIIYGAEFDVYDDINLWIVKNEIDCDLLSSEYVFFDLETTSISPLTDEIIEFGAVKYKNGKNLGSLQLFIKPTKPITAKITELTNITNDDVKDGLPIKIALKKIQAFLGDAILVAHNANFDYSFLNHFYRINNFPALKNPVIDTLKLSWVLNKTLKNHRLGTIAKSQGVIYDTDNAHRADYDAIILEQIYEDMRHKLLEQGVRNLLDINRLFKDKIVNNIFSQHITVLAKNSNGLKMLYQLISDAHIKYFNPIKKIPILPLSVLLNKQNRQNLLIGSSCSRGLLFEAVVNNYENLEEIFNYYDYIEIFPPSTYENLILKGFYTKKDLELILKTIIKLSAKYQKILVVSSNGHYVNSDDKIYRDIYIANKGLGGAYHPLHDFKNPKAQNPDQHFRTIEELIDDFKFLKDEKLLEEIIITNPNLISHQIEYIEPTKTKLYPPTILKSEENLFALVDKNLLKRYGKNPHIEILNRLEKEKTAIVTHKYSSIYYLSSLAVRKSLSDGYIVGSRGSVGSSLIATLADITEVNPLRPHYRCPNCQFHQFVDNVASGFDLPTKRCLQCNKANLIGDGQIIPFETFLGFKGDKVPDIDLNFSRDYQSDIHNYMRDFLGEKNVFRAGTISTVANKTAYGFVKNYLETREILDYSKSSIAYLAYKVQGTKRTTGQHPGGLIIVPDDMEIYDFTPINYPGNDLNSNWKTTHFDFHSIHENLLKLDFLGHLDPSIIRMLERLTNVKVQDIPMNDLKVLSLFQNCTALNYQKNYTNEDLGLLGIPEFGTQFVRELVREAKPQSFADAVLISGLSHGTDVWSGNAQKVIAKKQATLSEVISLRDDIMTFLISKGLDELLAFKIMESVRKGKGLSKEWISIMVKHKVPDWYIESCQKIKYMFPKAHAVAYVIMAFRIGWWKIYYPLEYYATYFTKRDVMFDIDSLMKGLEGIIDYQKTYEKTFSGKEYGKDKPLERDKAIYETYNILIEMYSRGYSIAKLSIEKSLSDEWIIDHDKKQLVPPFSILDGLGVAVSDKLIQSRIEKPFESFADFQLRSGVNKTILAKLKDLNLLKWDDKINLELEKQQQTFIF